MALSRWTLPRRPEAGNSDRNGLLQRQPFIVLTAALCCLLLAGCAPLQAGLSLAVASSLGTASQEGDEPLGVVTYVKGDVTIEDPLVGRAPGLMQILVQYGSSAMRKVRSGTTVYTGQDAEVTIVCVNGHVVRITSSGARQVTSRTCGDGARVPNRAAQSAQPDNGTLHTHDSSTAAGPETREKLADYGRIPIIISPRNTALLDLAPPIQWVAVSAAREYVLQIISFPPLEDRELAIPSAEADCAPAATFDGYEICSLAWPAQWPLEPGESYFLEVGARLSIAGELRRSESSALEALSAADAERVQADRGTILDLDLDVVTENLLLAGISTSAGAYAAAIDEYRTALAAQPTPIVAVALGDLYRAVDLQRFAFAAYAEALRMLDAGGGGALAVRAAAEFGQGQVEFAFENYDHASRHYEQAIALYSEVEGADEALVAAQLALQTALDRQ